MHYQPQIRPVTGQGTSRLLQGDAPLAFGPLALRHVLESCTAREFVDTFDALTGLSLRLDRFELAAPRFSHPEPCLCPLVTVCQRTGQKLPAQCGQCIRERWLSANSDAFTRAEFRGLCGCFFAELDCSLHESIRITVHDPAHRLPERALRLLRLIARQLQAEFQAACTRCALDNAKQRIFALEQKLQPELPATPLSPPVRSNGHLIEAMKHFAQANWQQPFQLRDVASALKMNPSYLCDLFSKYTGTTFHDYLENFRLAKAREFLRDPARRVSEVAYNAGFSSAAHFCRVFRAREGVPPRVWRATHA